MKVKDFIKLATVTTTSVEIKESLSVSVFDGNFECLADYEMILERKVNSFRIKDDKIILFIK